MSGEWVTAKQAGEKVKVDRQTIYKMIADGRLPAVRVGKRGIRIALSDLETLLKPVNRD